MDSTNLHNKGYVNSYFWDEDPEMSDKLNQVQTQRELHPGFA